LLIKFDTGLHPLIRVQKDAFFIHIPLFLGPLLGAEQRDAEAEADADHDNDYDSCGAHNG
jgi:hypothetical protein